MDNQNLTVGENVYFRHQGLIPAQVLANNQKSKVQLQINGWLGTHWEPISKVTRQKTD
jgi:hypothetical protein